MDEIPHGLNDDPTVKTSEQISELAAALAAAQGMMENAVMNRVNPHFKSKYADLAAIFDAARKPLSANGLAIVQTIGDGVLHTRLLHTSGQWIASEHPLPMSGRPQEIGSALTYARRYSLSALIGIAADEDDDANAAKSKNGNEGEQLNSQQMEFVWEKVREYCDPDFQQEWVDLLVKSIGHDTLAEVPASLFEMLRQKIIAWPKSPGAASGKRNDGRDHRLRTGHAGMVSGPRWARSPRRAFTTSSPPPNAAAITASRKNYHRRNGAPSGSPARPTRPTVAPPWPMAAPVRAGRRASAYALKSRRSRSTEVGFVNHPTIAHGRLPRPMGWSAVMGWSRSNARTRQHTHADRPCSAARSRREYMRPDAIPDGVHRSASGAIWSTYRSDVCRTNMQTAHLPRHAR